MDIYSTPSRYSTNEYGEARATSGGTVDFLDSEVIMTPGARAYNATIRMQNAPRHVGTVRGRVIDSEVYIPRAPEPDFGPVGCSSSNAMPAPIRIPTQEYADDIRPIPYYRDAHHTHHHHCDPYPTQVSDDKEIVIVHHHFEDGPPGKTVLSSGSSQNVLFQKGSDSASVISDTGRWMTPAKCCIIMLIVILLLVALTLVIVIPLVQN